MGSKEVQQFNSVITATKHIQQGSHVIVVAVSAGLAADVIQEEQFLIENTET